MFERRLLRACAAELAERFPELPPRRELAAQMRDHRSALEAEEPESREPTAGARMLVELVLADVALLRTLEAAGIEREVAVGVVGRGNEKMLAGGLKVLGASRWMFGREPIARLTRLCRLLNGVFPFAPPAFERVDLPGSPTLLAFDYTRCPMADASARHEAPDLCAEAFCRIDHRIAEVFEVELERTETLAQGCSRCDFRWRAKS